MGLHVTRLSVGLPAAGVRGQDARSLSLSLGSGKRFHALANARSYPACWSEGSSPVSFFQGGSAGLTRVSTAGNYQEPVEHRCQSLARGPNFEP